MHSYCYVRSVLCIQFHFIHSFNNVQFATCFGYINHHQADSSVHGRDMFTAYSVRSILCTVAV